MSEHDDDPTQAEESAREADRVRQLILARRNRFMAAALAGAGVALNGCWDSSSGSAGAGGAGGQAGAAGEAGTGGVGTGGASGLGGVGGPSVCLSIDPCASGDPIPPCVCLEPPFVEDAGVDEDAGVMPPSVCLSFE